ncbi:acyltransferase [Erysipelothrix urinaevulpis]|uniref:acyltransferase n=1 Tax=Erysipelothrix urinaevulpis TaxID=2683717 RepID=UPI00135C1C34|nr:acyltransferase [Erysipelothrix urinaevulpis]
MSGRDQFQRLKKIINFLSILMNIFPKKFQVFMFNRFRNIRGKKGMLLRYILLKNISKTCGDNVLINEGVIIKNIQNISFGNNVSIQENSYFEGKGGIVLGDDISIAHSCSVLSTTHTYSDFNTPIKYQEIEEKMVTINNNVWIGCKVTILCGVEINTGSIIGANSLVNKNVDENVIVGGVPIRFLKKRG